MSTVLIQGRSTSNLDPLLGNRGKVEEINATNGAANVIEQGQVGGERNTSSPTNNYDATKHECNSTILNTQTTAQAISTGAPCFLMGINIHTALVGTLTITGLTNLAGAATDWVIPATTAAGSILPSGNARRCETALIATLSSATDYGKVMIDWRPI